MNRIKYIKEHLNAETVNVTHICIQDQREYQTVLFIECLRQDMLRLSEQTNLNDIILCVKRFLSNLSNNINLWSKVGLEDEVNKLCDVIDDYQQSRKLDKLQILDYFDIILTKLVHAYNMEDIINCKLVMPEQVAEIMVNYRVIDIGIANGQENDLILKDFYKYYWGISPERYWILSNNMKVIDYLGLILGMSYVQRGINARRLKYNTICMAAPSQDIFFDNEMLNYILNMDSSSKLKFCIQEVTPYELWYDMSVSKQTEHRSMYYYPQVGSMHHYKGQEQAIEKFVRYKEIYDTIMAKDLVYEEFDTWRENNHAYEEEDVAIWKMTADDANAIVEVKRLFDKPYENTFKENVLILEEMFAKLVERDIVPIVILPPFPQIFLDNMTGEMVERTMQVLETFKEKYPKLVILNYMSDEDFDDYYFADWSHLNYWGSNLLSEKLNAELDQIFKY